MNMHNAKSITKDQFADKWARWGPTGKTKKSLLNLASNSSKTPVNPHNHVPPSFLILKNLIAVATGNEATSEQGNMGHRSWWPGNGKEAKKREIGADEGITRKLMTKIRRI